MYCVRTEGSTRFFRLFAVVFAAMLFGCATTSFNPTKQAFSGTAPVTAIYAYSFLDLRQGSMGKNFLVEFQRQLDDAFSQEGIRTKQLWFNDSPVRGQFSLEATGPNPSKTQTRVPVAEVVNASQDDERQFGASHRLVVFPAFVMSSNTGSNFDIRWDLVDAKTNQSVWTTTSRSHHMKWFLGDENAAERAATVVQGLMSELRSSGVIGRRGT